MDLDAAELMRVHVEALFTLSEGRLIRVNDRGGAPAPRFFLGRTRNGSECWVREDIDPALAADLHRLCEAESVGLPKSPKEILIGPYVTLLSKTQDVERTWSGPVYVCPPSPPVNGRGVLITAVDVDCVLRYLREWREDVESGVPAAVSLSGREAVSICCSVRVTDRGHEAGVETHPGFRGQGHGKRAVAAWSVAVRDLGCVPLYSTSWDNKASRRLAEGLGLIHFGSDLHVT